MKTTFPEVQFSSEPGHGGRKNPFPFEITVTIRNNSGKEVSELIWSMAENTQQPMGDNGRRVPVLFNFKRGYGNPHADHLEYVEARIRDVMTGGDKR